MKYLANVLIWVTFLVNFSCQDRGVKPLFDKSINERTEELHTKFRKMLKSAEHGWKTIYQPKANTAQYTVLMKFLDDNNVLVSSDFNAGKSDKKALYRFDKEMNTQLVFETGTVFTEVYQLNNNDYEGEFVFDLKLVSSDSVVLVSKEDKVNLRNYISKLTLKKANKKDWDDLGKSYNIFPYLKTGIGDFNVIYKALFINNKQVATYSFNASFLEIKIEVTSSSVGHETITGFVRITPTGFYFVKPIKVGNTRLHRFVLDKKSHVFEDKENNVKIAPLDPDPNPNPQKKHLLFNTKKLKLNGTDGESQAESFKKFFKKFSKEIAKKGITVSSLEFLHFSMKTKNPASLVIFTNKGELSYPLSKTKFTNESTIVFGYEENKSTGIAAQYENNLKPLIQRVVGDVRDGFQVESIHDGINTTISLTDNKNHDNTIYYKNIKY